MSTTQIADRIPPPDRRRPWRREEYDEAIDAGIFDASERLELIEGEIIQKVPHNSPHATSISLCADSLREVFKIGFHVRVQLPVAIGEWSEPEPDIAVVIGTVRDYEDHHPSTAVLVIEISDTSLKTDRETKTPLYASAGIAECWILNLKERVLEVYRDPELLADGNRYAYANVVQMTEDAAIAPLAAPGFDVLVLDLLPRKHG